MKIDVRITNLQTNGSIKAFASVNLNDEFAIKGIKVMEGSKGAFIAMPSYKTSSGDYKDVCFPTTKELRQDLEKAVLDCYEQSLESVKTPTQNKSDTPTKTQEMKMS